jgi:hypothetical protein
VLPTNAEQFTRGGNVDSKTSICGQKWTAELFRHIISNRSASIFVTVYWNRIYVLPPHRTGRDWKTTCLCCWKLSHLWSDKPYTLCTVEFLFIWHSLLTKFWILLFILIFGYVEMDRLRGVRSSRPKSAGILFMETLKYLVYLSSYLSGNNLWTLFDWLSTIRNIPEMLGVEWSHFNDTLRLAFALKVDTRNLSREKQTSEVWKSSVIPIWVWCNKNVLVFLSAFIGTKAK